MSATQISQQEYLDDLFQGIYTEDEFTELVESSLHMNALAGDYCKPKETGGMEEWAIKNHPKAVETPVYCDWYHGTWQILRLLNMVAVPKWYPFYRDTLADALTRVKRPNVLISAAADYGMLCTLHQAIEYAGVEADITLIDICQSPLQSSQWYAARNGVSLEYRCDNLLSSSIPEQGYDLVVTDEFLTVLKDPDKPTIVKQWRRILKPGGRLVTTAMLGKPTTMELRESFAAKARKRLSQYGPQFFPNYSTELEEKLIANCERFASFHTRHMLRDVEQIRELFTDAGFKFQVLSEVETPGECVNPTYSYQIAAY
jgi:2-polyprenyl-3-methyl-5-hydroxy-6-metoxy-1,4-benzoquinol methylase